jgi:predicted translin family RNA/ssDNA-binding protein
MLRNRPNFHPQLFPLPLSDYVLGICDLTGELMRLAISSISKPNGRMKASQICLFVRGCKAGKTMVAQWLDPAKPNF